MTQTIKNLTRNYLNSLTTSYLINEEQKRRVIESNSQSGWIIFNKESLRRGSGEGVYNITSSQLKALLKEQIKTYRANDWKEAFTTAETGSESIKIDEIKIGFFLWPRARRITYGESWIAVKKKDLGDNFGSLMNDIDNVDLSSGETNRKVGERLDYLLNDPEIRNSTPPQMQEENVSSNGNQSNSSSNNSATQSIQFVVRKVNLLHDSDYYIQIEVDSLNVNGGRYTKIVLNGQRSRNAYLNGDLAVGNTILIENVRFSAGEQGLNIGNDFTEIRVVPSGSNPNNNEPESNFTPPPKQPTIDSFSFVIKNPGDQSFVHYDWCTLIPESPFIFQEKKVSEVNVKFYEGKLWELFRKGELQVGKTIVFTQIKPEDINSSPKQFKLFPNWFSDYEDDFKLKIRDASIFDFSTFYTEVRQKNEELAQEENKLVLLANELTNIIKKNNDEVCPKASKLGLKLPTIPLEALNYFQEKFFIELDEKYPLTDPINQQIIAENQVIRKKKNEGIKANVYRTYDKNVKKLEDYQQKEPFSPNSDLEKYKNQAIENINRVLTEKDNLRNIDLITLEGGKYLNWEEELTNLSEKDKVTAYLENFLMILKKSITEDEEDDFLPRKQPKNGNDRVDIGKIRTSSSLTEARDIAKKLIREIFAKYKVKTKDLEEIWISKKKESWIECLKDLGNTEQIIQFVQQLEKKAMQKSGLLNPEVSTSTFFGSAHLVVFVFVSIFIVGLGIIIAGIYRSRKVVKRRG